MGARASHVTDAELSVLEILWEHGPATVRTIARVLYPEGGTSKPATVLKLLERLEQKGLVARDRSGAAQQFHAEADRDALIGSQLRQIAERLSGNSLTPLLTHLVQAAALTDEERARLRELLDAGSSRPKQTRSARTKRFGKKSR